MVHFKMQLELTMEELGIDEQYQNKSLAIYLEIHKGLVSGF